MGGTPREVAEVVNNLVEGKLNSTGEFTLPSGTTELTITDQRASATSIILLIAIGSDGTHNHPWIKSRSNGSFVVGSGNNGQDHDFGYVIIG
jgi:hypothetical protein